MTYGLGGGLTADSEPGKWLKHKPGSNPRHEVNHV